MKNKPTKRYLRGKKSYENAMQHWEGKFPAFKELSLKDKRFWWKEDFAPTQTTETKRYQVALKTSKGELILTNNFCTESSAKAWECSLSPEIRERTRIRCSNIQNP